MRESATSAIERIEVYRVGKHNEAEMTITQGWHALGIGREAVKAKMISFNFYDCDKAGDFEVWRFKVR